MKLRQLVLLLLLGLLAGSLAHAATFVVAAGVSSYDDPDISPVTYACSDARALVQSFREAGVPETNLTLLTSEATDVAQRPARFGLLRALQRVREKAEADDTLVFFFAGHGMQQGEEPYLLTVDSLREDLAGSALSMRTVQSIMKGFRARHVLFIIDACRNDPDAGRAAADASLDERFARGLRPRLAVDGGGATSALLLACDVGQRAYAIPDEQQGALTYYLLKGLSGEAKAADGGVTLKSLSDYVLKELPAWAQRSGRQQSPRFENPEQGDFVLRAPGAVLQPAVVKPEPPSGQRTGEVLVRSEPAGATVLLGGRELGRTPATVQVPSGKQTLTLRLEGYKEVDVPVEVPADEVVQARSTQLAALPARLMVTTEPADCGVQIDGKLTNEVTPCLLELSPGPHVILVFDDRRARQETVVALPGKTVRPGTWTFSEPVDIAVVVPPGTELWRDPERGCSLAVPPSWEKLPAPDQDSGLVASWQSGHYVADLRVSIDHRRVGALASLRQVLDDARPPAEFNRWLVLGSPRVDYLGGSWRGVFSVAVQGKLNGEWDTVFYSHVLDAPGREDGESYQVTVSGSSDALAQNRSLVEGILASFRAY